MLVDKIRVLANAKGYSLTTLEKELGFGNGTITRWNKSSPSSEKLCKVADFFGVTIDHLLGRDENVLNRRDQRDIEKLLDMTKEELLTSEGLMFDGKPATDEEIQQILDAMQIGLEMAKKKNKEKFTPKKYRK
ncbi:MAG: hypothetical protein BI182_08230 [Acetobacterium sp. MES1]|uniref:helix-turn-helix domain-containing protein n=1 Tax=Acetobacterium sp. MES1 TaxID=1899015 RepID=UPI000B9C82EE|nr:helix-turn-helix transcriptional regulator [Acetobacterium sp. MES1]OXS26375.1 MAG: hypothetical protein BI182_08230 [Acetobacterium sp. MES1]